MWSVTADGGGYDPRILFFNFLGMYVVGFLFVQTSLVLQVQATNNSCLLFLGRPCSGDGSNHANICTHSHECGSIDFSGRSPKKQSVHKLPYGVICIFCGRVL